MRLMVGLVVFGIGIGLMVQSNLGLAPWDVLHQGLAINFGRTTGQWTIIVSFVVLLLWLPIRERYGLGTLINAVMIGLALDATVTVVVIPDSLAVRIALMVAGIISVGLASGLYIGAHLGPGPRDGLMTGLAKRGPSIRATRFAIEAVVLAGGWLLGGTVGVGTLLFAIFIGPLVQFFLRTLSF
jgi:uncharacterized membrane protein YczE